MRYRRWCLAMLGLIAAIMLFIAGMNYFVDPFGYFTFQSGDYADLDFRIDDTIYQRLLKAEHVLHFKDQYDAYIVGGSKAGSYQPDKFSELDGYRYFNMYAAGGTLGEYEAVVKFLLENAAPKKIVLCLSGGEVRRLTYRQDVATYRLPAVMTGKPQIFEYMDYLLKDVTISIDKLKERIKNKDKNEDYYNWPTGQRYLGDYYKTISEGDHIIEFTKKHVLNKLDAHLKTLFTTNKKQKYYQNCLDGLRSIKEMCEKQKVELTVVIAPSFIGEMSEHDSTYYWDYLWDMIAITDVWDFSGYHDINLNPYNFYNEGHFYYELADLMVDIMAGKASYDGFGVYVTKENVQEHIEQRKADYYRLQEEYERTGTVALQGLEDASWIH